MNPSEHPWYPCPRPWGRHPAGIPQAATWPLMSIITTFLLGIYRLTLRWFPGGLGGHWARVDGTAQVRDAEGKLTARCLRIPVVSTHQRGRPGSPHPADGDLDSLLGAVARGEHGAFELVYEQLREPVYRQVATVLRDPAQSEEVTQAVFLEPRSAAGQYDRDKGSAAGWALMIARRRAIDRVRSNRRLRRPRPAGGRARRVVGPDPRGRGRGPRPRAPGPVAEPAHRPAAGGHHPRLLRRPHPSPGGRDPRRPAWHRQGTHPGGPDQAPAGG